MFELRNKPRFVWLVRASFDGRPLWRATQDKSGSWGAFLLVTYSLGKQRKVTRLRAKRNLTNNHKRMGKNAPPRIRLMDKHENESRRRGERNITKKNNLLL
jgi:hypothetical protein